MSVQISISQVSKECPLGGQLCLPTGQLPFIAGVFRPFCQDLEKLFNIQCAHVCPSEKRPEATKQKVLFVHQHLLVAKVEK